MSKDKFQQFNEDYSLAGKNALITGVASGIGFEIAKMFARKGANVFCFDLNRAPELEEYIAAQGVKCEAFAGDITSTKDIEQAVAKCVEAFGALDVLVNCAGIGVLEPLAETSEKAWDKTIAVNMTGPVRMALEAGRHMIKNGGGSIVNIASQAGIIALEKHLAYGVSKAGLIQATKQIAMEWGQHNVRANAISPTVILTPMAAKNWNNPEGEALKKTIPSRRFGYPEEVAACAVFLASDAANLFNGANLVLDGGYTII